MLNKTFVISSVALCASLSCEAAIPFVIRTDASGNFISPHASSPVASYSGDGTVQANVTTTGPTDSDLLINNLTSGTLNVGDLRKFDDSGPGGGAPAGNEISGSIGAAIEISFTGGTGDLRLTNTLASTVGAKTHPSGSGSDSGVEEYTGFGITDIAGVTSINVKLTFSEPIASRIFGTPLGSGMALMVNDGVNVTRINTQLSYGGIVSDPNNTGTFTPGIAAGSIATAIGSDWDDFTITGGSPAESYSNNSGIATFTMNNGISTQIATIDPINPADPQSAAPAASGPGYNFIRGFNNNGNSFDGSQSPLTYITEQTWTITLDGADTFNANTHFVFSLDGAQHSNLAAATAAVPEPSISLLSILGISSFILRRQRK